MIYFEEEYPKFSLKNKKKRKQWLNEVAVSENHRVETLTYVFLNDLELLKINKKYLNHDYYTDIITFDNSDIPFELNGDIFISVDRLRENSVEFNTPFESEMNRVLVHGLLHLCGYKDKSEEEEVEMRKKENFYLELFDRLFV